MTKQRHPKADLLIALAEGKEIQYKGRDSCWYQATLYHLAKEPTGEFRIKPDTITVNGVEIAMPVLHTGRYDGWVTMQASASGCSNRTFYFITESDAKACYEALIKPFRE
jgi:hypothetical protein